VEDEKREKKQVVMGAGFFLFLVFVLRGEG